MRHLRENLLVHFSIVSFVAMAIIGGALAVASANLLRAQAIDALVAEAVGSASPRVLQVITPADLEVPMTGARYDSFDAFAQDSIVSGRTARVKLWAHDGTVIYSSAPAGVGLRFPENVNFQRALQGENSVVIKIPDAPDNEYERHLGTLMEVYTPIIFPGETKPQGVLEIYQYYGPTAERISDFQRSLIVSIGVGFIALYGVLLSIVSGGWRTITRQRAALLRSQDQLEARVEERTSELGKANRELILEITERKQAQEALRESEGKFRTLSEKSPNMIFINQGDKIAYANEACVDTMGYSFDEFYAPDFDFRILISPESRNLVKESFRKQIEGAEVPPVEYRLVTKDGGYLDAIHTTRLIQFRGEPAILGILTDVTERRKAEEEIRKLNEELDRRVRDRTHELEASNQELESFSYSVSHDLRAPLRAMDGFSRILMEDHSSELSEEGRRYLQRVRDSAKHMGKLVDDLLEFARLGLAEMRKQPFAPDKLARQVMTELTADGRNGHAEVSIVEPPECYGDPALLKHVYVNLLSNALKFTSKREKAKIEVGFRQLNGEGTYFIKDNGAGFDMKYADMLFGVFQRLHSPEEYEGTGVGLAIAQRVIQRHGGRIWAEAEVDRGATFFFTLGGNSNHD